MMIRVNSKVSIVSFLQWTPERVHRNFAASKIVNIMFILFLNKTWQKQQ